MIGRYAELDVNDLTSDETYKYRTKLDVKELADSIKKDGQMVPVIVKPAGDKYQLISGFRRREALLSLGKTKIQARIIDSISDVQARRISLLENLDRDSLSLWDQVLTAARFKKQGMKTTEIAKAFRTSPRTIQRYVYVAKAPADFSAALERDEITIQQAYEAMKNGIPCSELLEHGRSVRYLRSLPHRQRKKEDVKVQHKAGGDYLIQIRYNPEETELNSLFKKVQGILAKREKVEKD